MTSTRILAAIASSLLLGLAAWVVVHGGNLLAPWSEFLASESLGDATRGLCLLMGAFWVGATDSWRRSLEPAEMPAAWRYGGLMGAAAFIVLPLWPNVSLVGQWVTGLLWVMATIGLAATSKQRYVGLVLWVLLSLLAIWFKAFGIWQWGLAALYLGNWWWCEAKHATTS